MLPNTLPLLAKALYQTVQMVVCAGLISGLLGIVLGLLLYRVHPDVFKGHSPLYRLLGLLINSVRSIPFIILLVALTPLTRLVMGTSIGTSAAIVPLACSALPFVARLVADALMTVPIALVEAARAMGATPQQIILRVVLPEALPNIIQSLTTTWVTLVGYSAMAGAIGGGGLGDIAIRYGYHRFDGTLMLLVILLLIGLVQLLQTVGERLARAVAPP